MVGNTMATLHKLAYGVGMAFSASCFIAMGMLVGHAGAWSPLALCASFLLMLVIIAAVSELSALFPSAVGLRTYIRAGLGDSAALAAVLLYLVLVLLVGGLEVRVLAAVLEPLWPGLNTLVMTAGLFGLILSTQVLGWRASTAVQTSLVVLLLCAVGLLVAVAWQQQPQTGSSPPLKLPADDLASAIVIGLFLFASVEWITTLQVRHPADARRMPRLLLLSCVLLMLLFLGTTQAIVHLMKAGATVDLSVPQLALAEGLPPPWSLWLLLLVTGLALLSTCHAGLACAARLVYLLAREGHLPRVLTATNAAGAPVAALVAVALACLAAAAVVVHLPSADGVAEACALAICTVYALYLVSAARLRAGPRRPAWPTLLLPRALLWAVAGLLLAVMAATCWEAQQRGHLALALLPWCAAGLGLAAMRWRAARRPSPALPQAPLHPTQQ
jgi:amino acid transporter